MVLYSRRHHSVGVLVQNILIPANEHAVHLVLPTEDLPDHLAVAAFVC